MSARWDPCDGYDPAPSPEVAKVRDEFFGDGPDPHDPEVAEKARQAIEKRTPTWRRHGRQS